MQGRLPMDAPACVCVRIGRQWTRKQSNGVLELSCGDVVGLGLLTYPDREGGIKRGITHPPSREKVQWKYGTHDFVENRYRSDFVARFLVPEKTYPRIRNPDPATLSQMRKRHLPVD